MILQNVFTMFVNVKTAFLSEQFGNMVGIKNVLYRPVNTDAMVVLIRGGGDKPAFCDQSCLIARQKTMVHLTAGPL